MAMLKKAYVVDLCEPLLEIAQQRKKRNGWDNMEIVHADALSFTLPGDERADVVSFTYSLTMIPEWYAAIDRAAAMLKPGGCCAACDFFIGNPFRITEKQKSHNWATRLFWRVWFETDGVFPSTDHVPYLTRRFALQYYHQNRAELPYLPLVSAPYYLFLGTKSE
jgi:S-adenosylmethionine-diacylgycerolhomoserine-N-methlytransferase